MNTYLDSSVLIRILFGQPNRLASWRDITNGVSSELVRVETLRTIDRTAVRARLDTATAAERRSDALTLISTLHLVPISTDVLERAGDPFPTPIGTLDAIHLATALALRGAFPPLTLATHDLELAVAARSVGFEVSGA